MVYTYIVFYTHITIRVHKQEIACARPVIPYIMTSVPDSTPITVSIETKKPLFLSLVNCLRTLSTADNARIRNTTLTSYFQDVIHRGQSSNRWKQFRGNGSRHGNGGGGRHGGGGGGGQRNGHRGNGGGYHDRHRKRGNQRHGRHNRRHGNGGHGFTRNETSASSGFRRNEPNSNDPTPETIAVSSPAAVAPPSADTNVRVMPPLTQEQESTSGGLRTKQYQTYRSQRKQFTNSAILQHVSKTSNDDDSSSPDHDFHAKMSGIVQSKLNKLSSSNYTSILSFLQEMLDGKSDTFIQGFMTYFVNRLLLEQGFLPLYVQLCNDLCSRIPLIQTILQSLHKDFLPLFTQTASLHVASCTDDYEQFLQDTKAKRKRESYSTLLRSLYEHEHISATLYWDTVRLLLAQLHANANDSNHKERNEEYCVSLKNMIHPLLSRDIDQSYIAPCMKDIQGLSSIPSKERSAIPMRGFFRLMDLVDAWTPSS